MVDQTSKEQRVYLKANEIKFKKLFLSKFGGNKIIDKRISEKHGTLFCEVGKKFKKLQR